jgi:type 1 glutamine amidotransferase
MLGKEWVIADEFYQYRDEPYSRDKLHILLSIDVEKSDMTKQRKQTRKDNDYALSWCKNAGKGKMFYTALGHRNEVWQDPQYQAHLLGGIQWALGQLPGDAAPSGAK